MANKFFEELSRCFGTKGIESANCEDKRLDVFLHGEPALFISPQNDIFLLSDRCDDQEANDLYFQAAEIADEVFEYVETVQSTPLLHASGVKENFHLLADFGGAVLAGREREKGLGYEFVTWIWDYNRTGVSRGHYYNDSFREAKQDFAVRSGLIPKAQLFTPEQLTELYRATEFFLDDGPEPSSGQMQSLQEARRKIEYVVPNLTDRLEQGQGQNIEEPNSEMQL